MDEYSMVILQESKNVWIIGFKVEHFLSSVLMARILI